MVETASSPALLAVAGLSRNYGAHCVLRALSFELGAGAHAVVGPNGCGKSTLLRLVAGADWPTAGEVRVAGYNLAGRSGRLARAALAYSPDDALAYGFLTVRELWRFVHDVRAPLVPGAEPFDVALDAVAGPLGLTPFLDQPIAELSLGTERKTYVGAAFLVPAQLYVLDEPTTGLDVAATEALAQLIDAVALRACVLFSCHDPAFRRRVNAQEWTLAHAGDGASVWCRAE